MKKYDTRIITNRVFSDEDKGEGGGDVSCPGDQTYVEVNRVGGKRGVGGWSRDGRLD